MADTGAVLIRKDGSREHLSADALKYYRLWQDERRSREPGVKYYDPYMCEVGERICSECGAVVFPEDRWCHDCGARLITEDEAYEDFPEAYEKWLKLCS